MSPNSQEIREKLSNYRSIGFRPGETLRNEIETLAVELSSCGSTVTISDILRESVTAYWPQIQIYMRAKVKYRKLPAEMAGELITTIERALQLGMTPLQISQAIDRVVSEASSSAK